MDKDKQVLATAYPILEAERAKRAAYKFKRYFPDCLPGCHPTSLAVEDHVIRPGDLTPICRVLYGKHLQLFAAGGVKNEDGRYAFPERMFMKANRVGGTEAGAYELTCHMTGLYPHWWVGRRFDTPIDAWLAGDTSKTVRNIMQNALFGPPDALKSGMLPAHLIAHHNQKHGIPDAIESFWVKHVSGKPSMAQFLSYDQKREAFQGTAKHFVWLDEEPPEEIVAECLLRTMTTDGLLVYTFTPLQGITPFVQNYLETATMYDDVGTLVASKDGFWGNAA
jgi:phage terminase large subunit-like protein